MCLTLRNLRQISSVHFPTVIGNKRFQALQNHQVGSELETNVLYPTKKTTGTNLETELPKIKHTSTPESFYLPPPTSISKPTNILKPFRGLHKRTHFLHPKPPSIQAKVYGNCRRRLRSLIFLQLFFVKHVSPIFFSGEDGAQGRGGRWMSGRVLVP